MSTLSCPLLRSKTLGILDPFHTPHSNPSANPTDSVFKLYPDFDFSPSLLPPPCSKPPALTRMIVTASTGSPCLHLCSSTSYAQRSRRSDPFKVKVKSYHFSAQNLLMTSQITQNKIQPSWLEIQDGRVDKHWAGTLL